MREVVGGGLFVEGEASGTGKSGSRGLVWRTRGVGQRSGSDGDNANSLSRSSEGLLKQHSSSDKSTDSFLLDMTRGILCESHPAPADSDSKSGGLQV